MNGGTSNPPSGRPCNTPRIAARGDAGSPLKTQGAAQCIVAGLDAADSYPRLLHTDDVLRRRSAKRIMRKVKAT